MPAVQLGVMQKGDSDLKSLGIYDFSGGLNVRNYKSPQLMQDNELLQALNGYVTSAGWTMRNGMSVYQSQIVSGSLPCLGLARFYQLLVNGVPNATPPVTLAQVDNILYNAQTSAPIGAIGTSGETYPMTWVRCGDPNDPNYIGGVTDVIVICTGSGGPYVYDGANLYAPSGWASAANARWCAMVNGIVWFGGIKGNPRTIYSTGFLNDGYQNSFETLVPSSVFVMSQPVAGLCALGSGPSAALVIGQVNGLSILFGTSYLNFSLQDIPFFFDGPVSGRAMCFEAGILYFLGKQAVYAFDGADPPVQISKKIEPWILNDLYVPGFPLSGDVTTSFMAIQNNRLYLGYPNGGGNPPNTLLTYDLVVQGWTVQRPTPGLYCMAPLDAPGDPIPVQFVAGSSAGPQVYTWDVESPIGVPATDAGSNILCTIQTKPFKTGVPGTNKALMRTYPEFFLNGPFNGSESIQVSYGANIGASVGIANATIYQTAWVGDSTRTDWSSVQGESFSFIFSTQSGSSPWTLQGLTALYHQRGLGNIGSSFGGTAMAVGYQSGKVVSVPADGSASFSVTFPTAYLSQVTEVKVSVSQTSTPIGQTLVGDTIDSTISLTGFEGVVNGGVGGSTCTIYWNADGT